MKLSMLISIFMLITVKTFDAEKIICDDFYRRELKENEIVFFESPNFPLLTEKNILNNCVINITGNSGSKTNMYLILVITNGYITNGKIDRGILGGKYPIRDVTESNIYFFTPGEALTFYFSKSKLKGAEAFQGFVTYEQKTTNRCLLSNKNDIYHFKEETEIYYLRSSFEGLNETNYYQQRRCLWRFMSLPGFGIKVQVLGLNYFTTKLHVVTDSVREYITGPTTKYYNDSEIAISYNDKHGAFEAKISVFKLPFHKPSQSCIFDNETLTWQTDPSIYYGKRIHCWKFIEIRPNQELKVTVSNYIYNETGNLLQFYTDEDRYFSFKFFKNKDYIFLPYRNNTIRNLTFEFKSDENVVNQKFKIKFDIIECKCPQKRLIIPCLENIPVNYSITGRNDHFYCSNQECTFEIQTNKSCPNHHILLETTLENNRNRYDTFIVWSDNEVITKFANVSSMVENEKQQQALILPNRKTKVYFKSGYNVLKEYLEVVKLTLIITSFKEPTHLPNITLAEDILFHNKQLPGHSITTISIPENSTEDIFLELGFDSKITDKQLINCINLYREKDLSSKILINTSALNLGSTVTVYNHGKCSKKDVLFIIKMKKINSNNCLLKKTTLFTNGNDPISMIAGSKGPCEVVILNSASGNNVKTLWTNSKIENVTLYSFSNKRHELIKFNQNTLNDYGKMTFNSRIYILRIPTNKSALIELTEDTPHFNKPLISYYETKNYGLIYATKTTFKSKTNFILAENVSVNFTIVDFNLSKNGYLQIVQENLIKNFSLNVKSVTLNGSDGKNVAIIYKDPGIGFRGALIDIKVYLTNNGESPPVESTSAYLSTRLQQSNEMITVMSDSYIRSNNVVIIFMVFIFQIFEGY